MTKQQLRIRRAVVAALIEWLRPMKRYNARAHIKVGDSITLRGFTGILENHGTEGYWITNRGISVPFIWDLDIKEAILT